MTNPCAEWELLIQAEADGELDIVANARLARHAETCPACATLQTQLHNLSMRIRDLPGTAVKFTNRDDLPHSVVSARTPPAFKSKVLDTEDSFTFTFDKPGEYVYFCGLHPHMKGVVVVA